jgi:hypothetical protein
MATTQFYPDVKNAVVESAAGDISVVAAVTGKRIKVLGYVLTANTTGTLRFESAAGGTALTGIMDAIVGVPHVAPFNPAGWFMTAAGEALSLEATTTGAGGFVQYEVV